MHIIKIPSSKLLPNRAKNPHFLPRTKFHPPFQRPRDTYRGEIESGRQLLSRITLSRATPWYRETRPAKPKEISEQCIRGLDLDSPLSSPLARPTTKGLRAPTSSVPAGREDRTCSATWLPRLHFREMKTAGIGRDKGESLVRINLRGVRGFK